MDAFKSSTATKKELNWVLEYLENMPKNVGGPNFAQGVYKVWHGDSKSRSSVVQGQRVVVLETKSMLSSEVPARYITIVTIQGIKDAIVTCVSDKADSAATIADAMIKAIEEGKDGVL